MMPLEEYVKSLPGKVFKTKETRFSDSTEIVFINVIANLSDMSLYPKWFKFSMDFIVLKFPLEDSDLVTVCSCEYRKYNGDDLKVYSQEDFESVYTECPNEEWRKALDLVEFFKSTVSEFKKLLV